LVRSKTGRAEHFLLFSYASQTLLLSLQGTFYISYTLSLATLRYFPHPLINPAAHQPGLCVCGGRPGSPACGVWSAELGSLEE